MKPTIVTKRGQRIETRGEFDARSKLRQALGFSPPKRKAKGNKQKGKA